MPSWLSRAPSRHARPIQIRRALTLTGICRRARPLKGRSSAIFHRAPNAKQRATRGCRDKSSAIPCARSVFRWTGVELHVEPSSRRWGLRRICRPQPSFRAVPEHNCRQYGIVQYCLPICIEFCGCFGRMVVHLHVRDIRRFYCFVMECACGFVRPRRGRIPPYRRRSRWHSLQKYGGRGGRYNRLVAYQLS